jgi:hypothetical protein
VVDGGGEKFFVGGLAVATPKENQHSHRDVHV